MFELKEPISEDSALREFLVGHSLTGVYFIKDYVQLGFEQRTLTLLTDPAMVFGETVLAWTDAGHRDLLVAQIDHLVTETSIIPESRLEIRFDTGVRLVASLEAKDYVGPEAVIFNGENNFCWVL